MLLQVHDELLFEAPVGAPEMTERYVPVGWNGSKIVYDAVVLCVIGLYIGVFLWVAPSFQHVTLSLDDYTMRMNAFGTCAFLLLSLILSIGPAARLDPRFLAAAV
jgi:hypothetical protein